MKTLSRLIPAEIAISPKELADLWYSADADEQAMFFSMIAERTKIELAGRLEDVRLSPYLTDEGRKAMRLIGEYAEKPA